MRCRVHQCKTTNAAVDWMTCTATTAESRQTLWNLGESRLHAGECEGEKATRWHANGYSGWNAAGVALGERSNSVVLRLSGLEAAQQWGEAAAACENVSRLDLAVDTEFDPPMAELAGQIYRDAGHVASRNGRPPGRVLTINSDGGQTVYIGSRSSENFGRVYDKGREQDTRESGEWWRWETELKGDRAGSALCAMRSAASSVSWLHGFVAGWWSERSLHQYPSVAKVAIHNGNRESTSVERQLQWIARGVRPTILELIERVGRERVLFALGLLPQSSS